jgi:MFS transporter, putative metabolite:H+ symporter
MNKSVNAGARLDRLPVGPFHYGIFWLVGAGMFFDCYDLYVGTNVLRRRCNPVSRPPT